MKKWMKIVAAIQVVSVLIWLAQAVSLWPDGLWFAGWLLGLPGSVFGHWAAEQLLWMRASRWTVGLTGLALATLINLLIAYVLGAVCRRIYKVLKEKRGFRPHSGNEH
jgi:hypothetical protein